RTILCQYHVTELDRRQSVNVDQAIHPGPGNAVADEDKQMRAVKRIVFRMAAMESPMRHHRVGELGRYARKNVVEHAANLPRVAGHDETGTLAQSAKSRQR